jgi:uncharacterized CHY-type Zn-finger protein
MNQIINDERTSDQKQLEQYFVMGKDIFMSGWGHAKNKVSYAVWLCEDKENLDKLEKWVKSRRDMKNVITGTTEKLEFYINAMAITNEKLNDETGQHISIYQTTENHPAFSNK